MGNSLIMKTSINLFLIGLPGTIHLAKVKKVAITYGYVVFDSGAIDEIALKKVPKRKSILFLDTLMTKSDVQAIIKILTTLKRKHTWTFYQPTTIFKAKTIIKNNKTLYAQFEAETQNERKPSLQKWLLQKQSIMNETVNYLQHKGPSSNLNTEDMKMVKLSFERLSGWNGRGV